MTTSKELLTASQGITITLASLANGSSRASAVIDNTSNLFFDAAVQLSLKTAAASTSASGYCNIYAYASANNGTNYTEGATGSDAAITLTSPTNLVLIGTINMVANATTYTSKQMSIAAAFGYLPSKWGIVVQNNTGAALDSSEGSHTKVFEGQQVQSA